VYVPVWHAKQLVEVVAGPYFPISQKVQYVEPRILLYVPLGHVMHWSAFWVRTYPSGQSQHIVDELVGVYDPTLQILHRVDPERLEYFPMGHTLHADACCWLAYVPAWQILHNDDVAAPTSVP
jgi:hypothetical protein